MEWIDTHNHLYFPDYANDRAEVLERARQAGFKALVQIGTDLISSRAVLDLAHQHPDLFATCGYHPHDAEKMTGPDFIEIETLLQDPKMVAIGEVGLDFYRNLSPRETQYKVLEQFLDLHFRSGKPLVIHCRDAYPELAALLRSHRAGASYRGVMHCYSSDRKNLASFLNLGFYISFAGPLNYKKNDVLREACRECPKDRLLLETDAPFLPPEPYRGKRNESSYMIETAQAAAKAHGVSLEEISEITTRNARALFGI